MMGWGSCGHTQHDGLLEVGAGELLDLHRGVPSSPPEAVSKGLVTGQRKGERLRWAGCPSMSAESLVGK